MRAGVRMPAGEQVGAIVERIGTVAGAHQMLGIGRDLPATDEATAAGIEAGTRFTGQGLVFGMSRF